MLTEGDDRVSNAFIEDGLEREIGLYGRGQNATFRVPRGTES